MVDMYVRLIQGSDEWSIERVPVKYRDAVLAKLNTLGLDGNGDPLPVNPPEEPTQPTE